MIMIMLLKKIANTKTVQSKIAELQIGVIQIFLECDFMLHCDSKYGN